MRMIKKILGTIFDYPVLNVSEKAVNEEIVQDYWDEYFKGKDVLEMEVPYFVDTKEKKSQCKIFKFENYRQEK